jgi:hypothetical protein
MDRSPLLTLGVDVLSQKTSGKIADQKCRPLLAPLVSWVVAVPHTGEGLLHPAPMENLAHVDVALIDRAEPEIDLAAYVLTDWPIMQGLTCAADHGVQIHTYFDGTQLAER